MKVLHLSSSDKLGGAAKACLFISRALSAKGVDSRLLVQQKVSRDGDVESIVTGKPEELKTKARIIFDYGLIKMFTKEDRGRFTLPYIGTDISNNKLVQEADVLHLHWINGGYLSLNSLRKLFELNKPVVWTLHDMWAFTGGCHYTGGCENFLTGCGNCPSLKSAKQYDRSYKIFKKKVGLYSGKDNINITTCSKWLGEEAGRSPLLGNKNITVIPNPINIENYMPVEKGKAREKLNIPREKIIIMFSAFTVNEKRKGFEYLKAALRELYAKSENIREKIELVVLGSSDGSLMKDIPFKLNLPGRISDEELMAMYYNSADVFVAPSTQENLSNTVMESLACGTPVLAFNIGGMPDMIDHKINGFLAYSVSAEALSEGLLWIIGRNVNQAGELRRNARDKVMNNFTPDIITEKYLDLYNKLLTS